VVKGGQIGPSNGVVTLRAIGRGKGGASARVWRVVGLLPGGEVAAWVPAVSCGNLQVIVVIDVTLLARNIVTARKRKTNRWSGVVSVERCSQPTVKCCVAALAACGRKVGGISRVRGVGRVLPVLHVAGVALCG